MKMNNHYQHFNRELFVGVCPPVHLFLSSDLTSIYIVIIINNIHAIVCYLSWNVFFSTDDDDEHDDEHDDDDGDDNDDDYDDDDDDDEHDDDDDDDDVYCTYV